MTDLPAPLVQFLTSNRLNRSQVNLLSVIDEMSGTFSGGMKRRLSVAISMIGNPLCCYLVPLKPYSVLAATRSQNLISPEGR